MVKDSWRGAKRNEALRDALKIVCQELDAFIKHRFKDLHKVAEGPFARKKAWRRADVDNDPVFQREVALCTRIGQVLDKRTTHNLRAEEVFPQIYSELVHRLAEEKLKPLRKRDLPGNLRTFCGKACDLANKLASDESTEDDQKSARLMLLKAVNIAAIIGALIGLEQDAASFLGDVKTGVVKGFGYAVEWIAKVDWFVLEPQLWETIAPHQADLAIPAFRPYSGSGAQNSDAQQLQDFDNEPSSSLPDDSRVEHPGEEPAVDTVADRDPVGSSKNSHEAGVATDLE